MTFFRKWAIPAFATLLLIFGLTYAFWPRPVPVDLAVIERGPMQVTTDDEGETRVTEYYLVSAPLAGRVLRFNGDVGDAVVAGQTPLATIRPTAPAFLDNRSRSELEASVKAAEAAKEQSETELERFIVLRDFAVAEYKRALTLTETDAMPKNRLDRFYTDMRAQEAAVKSAQATLYIRDFELERARAALINPVDPQTATSGTCCFIVKAPVGGRILRILQESESVVNAGTPLVEIGDPRDLEIVSDFLSNKAVLISQGDDVIIEDWGGNTVLTGKVRLVEPFGFTKVSTLGIEEQRVNVVIDFTEPYEKWQRLGHGYRVDVRVVTWQKEDVVRVPLGALFRHEGDWAVFAVADGRAHITPIQVGHINTNAAEVIGGLEAGQEIVLHPSNRVSDGATITERDPT